jgi:exosortase/archaeosortase family protein
LNERETTVRESPPVLEVLKKNLEGSARARIAGRILISAFVIFMDVRLVPSLYLARTFYALAAFAALAFFSHTSRQDHDSLPPLTTSRVALFAGLHILLVAAAALSASSLKSATSSYSALSSLISVAKVLIVFPTLLLFWSTSILRRYSSEFVAAIVVLFTFFPERYLQTIWPVYSRLLTQGLATFGGAFVPGTILARTPSMFTVTGPSLIMLVDFQCSGITGIELFQFLFGLVVIVEWNRLNKRRALICYFLGIVTYIAANFLRLVLLYIIGNRISRHPDLESLGWVLFALTFFAIMKVSYLWIVRPERPQSLVKFAKAETA